MEARVATKVGIVILGDEVLKGEVREANLAYMLPLLAEWGAETTLCAILPDDIPVVVRHLRAYLKEADLLILTGGIGPTPDDITRDAVAEVAGVPLVVDEETRAALEARPFQGGNPKYRMLMAHVPQGSTLIPNPYSPAPGFYVHRMAAFPGIPRLLQAMFGWVRPLVEGSRKTRVTLYSMAPESSYAGIMGEMIAAYPDVGIGSYPVTDGEYRVRVVFRGPGFARTAECAARFEEKLAGIGYNVLRRLEERGDDA
ncbi:MAG: competence/damage-inducible protein A [Deltaproteobacteria bacterium]|nr:competence/damage-inducible protein A [Deltaproteobacteria bacterium]